MADFFEDDDPDSNVMQHFLPLTLKQTFRLNFKPLRDTASDHSTLDDDSVLSRRHLFNRVPGRTDQRNLFVNVKTRSNSPGYQVPAVKQWTPIQLSSAPSRFRPLKSLVPGALPETYTARHGVLRQNCVVKVIDLRSFVDQNSGVWLV